MTAELQGVLLDGMNRGQFLGRAFGPKELDMVVKEIIASKMHVRALTEKLYMEKGSIWQRVKSRLKG